MARSVPLRRTCPEVVGRRMEQALQATAYILHQTGPMGFVVKEEGSERKLKVLLGERHLCSCSTFKKEKELCRHILWVLLKKFRIPRENPITFQLGLVEREINEVLHGYLGRQQPKPASCSGSHDHKASLKEIGSDDVCPICQEELLFKPLPLTYCKFGCGNSMHIKCMKIWAEHQKSNGEKMIKCPLCREDFGTYQELCRDLHSTSSRRLHAQKSYLHLGVSCNHCHMCPITGKCYRCTACANYHLCHNCFTTNQFHVTHPFEFRQHPSHPWRPATRATGSTHPDSLSTLPRALINGLQSRSLTESDYDLLLQLDRPHRVTGNQGVPKRVLNSFHVEPIKSNSHLLQTGASCQLCMNNYCRGEWVRKLPCKHQFHRDCIDPWLRSGHTTCPIDGQQVYEPSARDHNKRLLPKRSSQADGTPKKRVVGSLARALSQQNSSDEELEFTISGQSIGITSQERVDVPTAPLPGGQLKTSTHILPAKPISSGMKQPAGKSSHFLPKISSYATSICSRRSIVESSKRLLKRRQSFSPPSSDNCDLGKSPLAPTCSGYMTSGAPLPSVPSHSPPMGRLRKGSLAGTSGHRKNSDTSLKDFDPEELLDSSLQVSSFKLCPLPPTNSMVIVSQS